MVCLVLVFLFGGSFLLVFVLLVRFCRFWFVGSACGFPVVFYSWDIFILKYCLTPCCLLAASITGCQQEKT